MRDIPAHCSSVPSFVKLLLWSPSCNLHAACTRNVGFFGFFFCPPPRLFLPLIAVDAAWTTFKMRYLSCWRLAPGRRCPFYPRRYPAACPCCPGRARGCEAPRPGPGSLLPAAPSSSSPRCQTPAPEPGRCLLSGSGEADVGSPWLTAPLRGGQRAGSSRTGCHRRGELLLWVGAGRAAGRGTGTGRRGRCKMALNGFGAKSCCGLGKNGRGKALPAPRGETRAPSELPAPAASALPPRVGETAGRRGSALLWQPLRAPLRHRRWLLPHRQKPREVPPSPGCFRSFPESGVCHSRVNVR